MGLFDEKTDVENLVTLSHYLLFIFSILLFPQSFQLYRVR
jgi:hypothetical protein